MGTKSDRLDYIDTLRCVAIMAVVLVHCGQQINGLPPWLRSITDYGARGVQLFFILSALTLSSVSSGLSPQVFYLRRFFRIAPMFYLALVFYLAVNGFGPRYAAPHGIGPRQIIQTMTFTHGFAFDSINSVVPGGWSIAAEAMFYAMFPALAAWLTTIYRTLVALALSLFLLTVSALALERSFATYEPQYLVQMFELMSFPFVLHAFLLGMLAFHLIGKLSAQPVLAHHLHRGGQLAVPVLAAIILLFAIPIREVFANYIIGDILLFLLVLGVAFADEGNGLLERAMRHIGVVSFSIYLVHFAVVDLVADPLRHAGLPPVMQLTALFLVTLGVSTGLASLTYRVIERPFIELGRRLGRNMRRAPSAAPA